MEIKDRIKQHCKELRFSRITRKTGQGWEEISRGYIIDHSRDFIVLQESDDFKLLGFNILPVKHIKKIRYNKNDRYYDKIMSWENQKKGLGVKTKINLKSWKQIFESFSKNSSSVIVECEHPDIDSFTIGEVVKVTNKSVQILNFDAAGYLDSKPTKICFKDISKVMFDDRYIKVFSKYLRKRK